MSLNLQSLKRKLDLKLQQGQEKEALKTVLLQQLVDNYKCKDLKEGEKILKTKIKDRDELEDNYQERIENLEKEIEETNILGA